jgi:hypothetical protein
MACREALGIFRLSITFTKWHHSSQGKNPSGTSNERIDYLFDRGKSEDLRSLVCGTKKMTVTAPDITCALPLRREYGKRIETKGIRSPKK